MCERMTFAVTENERSKRMNKLKIGDFVKCVHPQYYGVKGEVIKQYYPTTCEQQTMIMCDDGRKFHAPTRCFIKE